VPVSVAPKSGTIPETGFMAASLSVIVTVDASTPSAIAGVVPVIVELAATATPDVKTTVPSALVNGALIDRVLVSALVELRAHVETPEAFETEHAP
jgi:predicted anti-sigma-YlaC factor YlaD